MRELDEAEEEEEEEEEGEMIRERKVDEKMMGGC